jgi:DNA processing protein
MSFPIKDVQAGEFPPLLREIPQPPKQLNYRGKLPSPDLKLLSIVGSRKYTTYGKQVIDDLLSGLRNVPIGIVSGLALGIDSLAHEAALKNNLYTVAIPGGGLDDSAIYPARHKSLAHRILAADGGLLSEYEPTFKATTWSFPERNRLVAGISHATLLVEAAEKSGTLITARMATDYNRELCVVPGSIFSKQHVGIHQFLKLGAIPVTGAADILDVLGISKPATAPVLRQDLGLSPGEERILELLTEPTHRDELARTSGLAITTLNQLLMSMELQGYIASEQNIYRTCL